MCLYWIIQFQNYQQRYYSKSILIINQFFFWHLNIFFQFVNRIQNQEFQKRNPIQDSYSFIFQQFSFYSGQVYFDRLIRILYYSLSFFYKQKSSTKSFYPYQFSNSVIIIKTKFQMLSEDSQEGDMYYKFNQKASQCSTYISFSPDYQESFYFGTEESASNLVNVQVNSQKIIYSTNRWKKSLSLFLTTIEQFIYLRDQKSVFAIKLTKECKSIIFSTFQQEKFIALYLILAKNCILTGFQKHYRVGSQIGSGAFGTVYNGFNILSNQNVALKVLSKKQIYETENGIQMMRNQIKILEKLKNYRISPLKSTYETEDCFILVLEKGDGGNLMDYIQNHSEDYGQQMLKKIMKQVLEYVHLIHEAGFIHRDIKPENIICKNTKNPSIFMCDYGISSQRHQSCFNQKEKYVAGTIGYVAPEIINEEDFDEKSDIFSIGCVFYYLFTGKKLFQTNNSFELQMMCQDSVYIEKRIQKLKNLDPQLQDLLENMLSYSSQDRPSPSQALRHSYFKQQDPFVPNLGEIDDTLKEYLQNKISNYWN